jgi:hypothetical protein
VLVLFITFLVLFNYLSPVLSQFLAKTVDSVMTAVLPRFIQSVSLKNNYLEVVTYFSISSDPKGQLAFDINPLKYTYGFPLFIALTFSVRGHWPDKVWHIFIAYFVTLLVQTWGVCFDITRHLLFEFNGAYAAYFEFSGLGKMLVSLGSQLGFLLLPSLVPIILWSILENKALRSLIKGVRVN